MERFEFTYEEESSERLDMVLLHAFACDPELSEVSRSQLKRWIEEGRVSVSAVPVEKAGFEVKSGVRVSVSVPEPRVETLTPYDFPLSIVFEDEHLVVVDKPAGLSMHPGAGNYDKTLLNALIARDQNLSKTFLDQSRLGIVHRLDKDTTGIVIVAKTIPVHTALQRQFAERKVKRLYQALVFTTPRSNREVQKEESGTIKTLLGRHPRERTLMAVVTKGGRNAITHWRRKERFSYGVTLEVRLETGRTHQIRVHMEWVKSPVIGDRQYGDFSALPARLARAADEFGRQALHASQLGFIHPQTQKELLFESKLPVEMERLLSEFRELKSG